LHPHSREEHMQRHTQCQHFLQQMDINAIHRR
jgi:hypothetical protein